MAEYIEREAAFNAVLKLMPKVDDDGYCWVIRGDAATAINTIPAADVRPVVTAHWYWDKDGMDWGIGAWRCDNCKSKAETWWASDKKYNPLRCSGGKFCGNCGADMREES